MGEGIVLESIKDLHQAMYDRLATITGVTGLEFIGFDDSRRVPTLPAIGMKIALGGKKVDRGRPTPGLAGRLEIKSGPQQDFTVGGVLYPGVFTERTIKYPLPMILTYKVWTWCKSSETAILLDEKLLQKFPERGTLHFTIGTEDGDFPITLQSITALDDLKEAFRESVYEWDVECWIKGHIEDETRKIITKITDEIYQGSSIEDGVPANKLGVVITQPD